MLQGDGDSRSSSASLGKTRNPVATDAAELCRNPAVTEREGSRVTFSVTQITGTKPAQCGGWLGDRFVCPRLQGSGCPSGVTAVLENQTSAEMALHRSCPKALRVLLRGPWREGLKGMWEHTQDRARTPGLSSFPPSIPGSPRGWEEAEEGISPPQLQQTEPLHDLMKRPFFSAMLQTQHHTQQLPALLTHPWPHSPSRSLLRAGEVAGGWWPWVVCSSQHAGSAAWERMLLGRGPAGGKETWLPVTPPPAAL